MPVHVVYVDQVVLGSIIMNYAILWAAGKMGGVDKGKWRLGLASAMGGIYSAATFVPAFSPLLSVWFKILFSFLIIFAAFAPQPPVRLAVCLAFFYLASFALGGSVMGIMYFFSSHRGDFLSPEGFSRVTDRYFWYAVALALVFFWAAGRGVSRLWKRRYATGRFTVTLLIRVRPREIQIVGLVDSGNRLTDPGTGNPVMVAEYEIVKELLPPELVEYWDRKRNFDPLEAMEFAKDRNWGIKLRLIPFQSLGTDSGLLLGFSPDEVEVSNGDNVTRRNQVTVAVYPKPLAPDSAYHVLVPPDLLDTD